MTTIIAKLKSEYKKVLSDGENILDTFNAATIEQIEFTPSHKLEDNEWFVIKDFSTTKFFIEQCCPSFSTINLNQIEDNDYNEISTIVVCENKQKHFQRITPALFVNKKTMLLNFSGQPKVVTYRKQIEIRDESDATYVCNSDILYFKHIGKIKTIFPGIEELYREATQNEVDTFIAQFSIKLYSIENNTIGAMNRKRIAVIREKYNKLSDSKKQTLKTYAIKHANIEIDDGNFIVRSEEDLKQLLYAVDQRYYYADIYDENRVANSIRVVKDK